MLDLSKKFPSSVITAGGGIIPIKTDFRIWLKFAENLQNNKIGFSTDLDFIFINGKCPNIEPQELIKALLEFLNPPRELPRAIGKSNNEIILDYFKDADLIYSAFLEQYKIDLFEIELHWHKFLALLSGLHNTKLNEVMSYRSYDPTDKTDHKDQMVELKKMWEIPREMSADEKEALEQFDALLK